MTETRLEANLAIIGAYANSATPRLQEASPS
jgi:hypothetical protein